MKHAGNCHTCWALVAMEAADVQFAANELHKYGTNVMHMVARNMEMVHAHCDPSTPPIHGVQLRLAALVDVLPLAVVLPMHSYSTSVACE